MQIKEIMTARPVLIHPDTTLQEAAQRMREFGIGALPVTENNELVGMLTDRDITVRSVSDGHDPRTDKVRDAMTPEVICCFEDQDVAEAAHLMKQKQVRRLVVLNREKQVAGIVSLANLAANTGNQILAGNVLQAVSQSLRPAR